MNSILLPNKEEKPFDSSKCFVTLEQIESMITEAEQTHDQFIEEYNTMGNSIKEGNVVYTKGKMSEMIIRIEGKISALKYVRHMAYVNGGYRQE